MDQVLKDKLIVALESEIEKGLTQGTISEDDADDASADFMDMLDSYTNQDLFIEDFAQYIGKYPFTTEVGEFLMAQFTEDAKGEDIEGIRKQLQAFIQQ